LQTLKLSLLFRNALVQVLALKVRQFRSEQPGIALDIPLMAQNFRSPEVSHRRHLLEMVNKLFFGMGWRVRRLCRAAGAFQAQHVELAFDICKGEIAAASHQSRSQIMSRLRWSSLKPNAFIASASAAV
jgi:hypothetical protein